MGLLVDPVAIHVLVIFSTTFSVKGDLNLIVLLFVDAGFTQVFQVHRRLGKLEWKEGKISQGIDTFAVFVFRSLGFAIDAAGQAFVRQNVDDGIAQGVFGTTFVTKFSPFVLEFYLERAKIKGYIEVTVIASAVYFHTLAHNFGSFGISVLLTAARLGDEQQTQKRK